jgi:hypothetical protein
MKYFAYLMSAILLVAAVWYGKQRQYKRSAIFAGFWMAPLVIGISIGNALSIEQWLCWSFACASLYYAHKLLKENHIGYAFVTFLVATFIFFCGLTSVQTLLKTHLLWQVTSALGSYGEKLDTFQTTVTGIRQSLEQQQTTNEAHQVELKKIQTAVRKSVNDVALQQNDITNQYRGLVELNGQLAKLQDGITNQFEKLVLLQGDLTTAQTNLSAQQRKIEDVEFLVESFWAKMEYETISASDTNKVVVYFRTNDVTELILKLKYTPIKGSLKATVKSGAGLNIPQSANFPSVSRNVFMHTIVGFDLNSTTYEIQYTKDTRDTKPATVVEMRSGKLFVDGELARITP